MSGLSWLPLCIGSPLALYMDCSAAKSWSSSCALLHSRGHAFSTANATAAEPLLSTLTEWLRPIPAAIVTAAFFGWYVLQCGLFACVADRVWVVSVPSQLLLLSTQALWTTGAPLTLLWPASWHRVRMLCTLVFFLMLCLCIVVTRPGQRSAEGCWFALCASLKRTAEVALSGVRQPRTVARTGAASRAKRGAVY